MKVDNAKQLLTLLGQKIRAERVSKGWSQEELAEKAGLHRTYIGMIERAEKNLTVVNLNRIAVALDLSIRDLLDFEC